MTLDDAIKCLEKADITVYREPKTQTAEALEMAIKALEQTRWIPVTECLPEEDGEYFVTWITSRSKRPLLEIYEYSCGEWNIDNGGAYPDAEIIAWMSLPKCYMAESEDNT